MKSTGMRGNLKCAKTVIRRTIASGSGMTDQEAMNKSRAGLKTLLLKNTRIQPQYRAVTSRYLILRSMKE